MHIVHRPLFVSVEPAAVCQLRCPQCPVGMRNEQQLTVSGERLMSRRVWERVLQETAPYALTMQFYFQGEPLLHPDLPQMIREAHEAGLHTIVSTNAQAMTPAMADALVASGLDRIIVSMDGLTQASYQAYRVGGRLERCREALRWLREAKERQHRRITIELQCLRLRSNEQEWSALRRVYKSLGADYLTLKTAQLYDYAEGNALMPTDARYSRYRKGADGRYHRKPRHKGCLRVWSGVVVTTTGDVLPCCYDKAHTHAYGNIMSAHMHELFAGDQANAFRRAALHEQPGICQECWR